MLTNTKKQQLTIYQAAFRKKCNISQMDFIAFSIKSWTKMKTIHLKEYRFYICTQFFTREKEKDRRRKKITYCRNEHQLLRWMVIYVPFNRNINIITLSLTVLFEMQLKWTSLTFFCTSLSVEIFFRALLFHCEWWQQED